MNKPTCASCRWFKADDEYPFKGECHRYPPTAQYIYGETENERKGGTDSWSDTVSSWPQIDKNDWCGEHEPKEEDT